MLDKMEATVEEYENVASSGGWTVSDQREAMNAAAELGSQAEEVMEKYDETDVTEEQIKRYRELSSRMSDAIMKISRNARSSLDTYGNY